MLLPRLRRIASLGLLIVGASGAVAAAAPPAGMLKVRLDSGVVEGQPLSWDDEHVYLLARDGQLLAFPMADAQEFSQSAPRFSGLSYSELRSRLEKEFGRDYEVTGTAHYLVVHPRGKHREWAERFEQLYRSFCHYFQVRGAKLSEPPYPMVAVIFPSQQAYLEYSNAHGMPVRGDFLGHYASNTNRIYLFDNGATANPADWARTAATIIHEATHQTAYNTGIHRRFNGTPRWLAEGLAMMFETPGVSSANSTSTQRDRILVNRLRDFRDYAAARRPPTSLAAMLASDQPFNQDPIGAYAQAWAFSFFLSETHPREYAAYLARTAARPDFQPYTAQQRLADFTAVFGKDLAQLDAQFLRWIERLK